MMRLRLTRPPLSYTRFNRRVQQRFPQSILKFSDPIVSPGVRASRNIRKLKVRKLRLTRAKFVYNRHSSLRMVHGFPWKSLVPLDSIDRLSFRRSVSLTRSRPR